MKLFVVHRSKDRKKAALLLKKCAKEMNAEFRPIFLDSSECETWKDKAIAAISKAEAVIVYDRSECVKSENARWEIEKAEDASLSSTLTQMTPVLTSAQN